MNNGHIGARLSRVWRSSLLALASAAGSLGAAAQVAMPLRYQLCEAQEPQPDMIHRLETNYRYPPAAVTRSFHGFSAYRCEPAWAQSPAIFNAIGVCSHQVSGCSADANGSCNDNTDDWVDYDFLGSVDAGEPTDGNRHRQACGGPDGTRPAGISRGACRSLAGQSLRQCGL